MTTKEILNQLEAFGNEQTKKVLMKHGAKEPFFGVKVADLKTIVKKVKKNHELSLELYETGNSDAMYLAGLIADEKQITEDTMQKWAEQAYWYMLSEYTVAWVAAESKYGWKLAMKWIEAPQENVASAGWATLSNLVMIKQDEELNIHRLSQLLERVEGNIHNSQNRVRYTMNGFVIAVGASVKDLTEKAMFIGQNIGKINVDMGGTSCKVPLAKDYIQKIIDMGRVGKKKKKARC